MPSIGELFIELGVVGDKNEVAEFDKKVKQLAKDMDLTLKSSVNANNGIKDFVKGIAGVVGAIAGATIALNKFTSDLVASNQSLLDLTRTTDIAQGTFQKWGSIGKILGVQNADRQLAGLNQRLFDLMLTGQGARGFQLAGINPVGQDAQGVLEQLRNRIKGMSDTSATYLLQQMGLDPTMLHLLRIARQDFEALGQTIKKYQLTPEQTKKIQAMNIQLQIAGIKLKYLKDKAIMALMPAWTKFIESLARVSEGLSNAVQYVSDFISKSPALQAALKGIAVAMGVILAVTHPLWAAFTALYLIIDDIVGYFQGKKSLLGGFLYALDELQDKINNSIKTPQWLKDLLALAGSVDDFNKLSRTISDIKNGNAKANLLDAGENVLFADNIGVQTKMLRNLARAVSIMIKEELQYKSGVVDDLSFVTPAMERSLSYSTTNTDNRAINMTNNIHTSQPAYDIESQLTFARNAMAWA